MRERHDFLWAVGIEDTFIPQVASRTGRILDEYELTQHYRFWREDIDRIASLGVSHVRYGIPWYRVNPALGRFDWSWTDEVLPYLVERARVTPIIDLMHYGCPTWLEGEFVNPSYPEHVADYAAAFVERYRGLVRYYTPLNEPLVNADFCGRAGIWPPYLRGDAGFARVIMALARGMSLTVERIRAAQSDAVVVQVEAALTVDTLDPALLPAVERRMERQFLATDLLLGRVRQGGPLHDWLVQRGVTADELAWFERRPQSIDVMGTNFYPRFSCSRLSGPVHRPVRHHRWGTGDDLEIVLAAYHERYRVPVMVTETSEKGRVSSRERWLDESVAAVRNAREQGVEVIGYTWFPVFSLVAWTYRRGRKPVPAYLYHMGLWDLREDASSTLERVATGLIPRYAALAAGGAAAVGRIAQARTGEREVA